MRKLTNLLPLSTTELEDVSEFQISESELQLQTAIINVLEKRVEIESFEPEYQEKIKNYYRFYGTRFSTKYPRVPPRTGETMDLV